MDRIPRHEYLRRRKLEISEMTGKEWASWWDFPNEFHGHAWVEIGGEEVMVDFTKGSVPTIIKRTYLPC